MACLPRLSRLNCFRSYVPFVRHLTSVNSPKNATVLTSLVNKSLLPLLATNNHWIWQKNDRIEIPRANKPIELPNGLKYILPLEDSTANEDYQLPTLPSQEAPKQAARLIVIRRRKMKRHKLKKLRKRMKFEWAKRRQRREWNKEKLFQAELIQQCKEGEAFSAEKYVEERLTKFNELTLQIQARKEKKSVKNRKV